MRPARLLLALAPAAFVAVFALYPVGVVLVRGLGGDGIGGEGSGLDVGGTLAVLAEPRTLRAMWTTVYLSLAGTAVSLLLGLPAAWALYRLRWPGARTLRSVLSVPFVLPTIVVAAAFTALLGSSGPMGWLGWDQSPAAIVAALAFYNVSVVLRVVGTAWAGIDSRREAAAATLGATRAQVLRHVTLPALLPAIRAAAAVTFLFCATSYGVVLVLGGSRIATIETEIALQLTLFLDLRAAAVLAIVQLVFVGAVIALTGAGRTVGWSPAAIKGRRARAAQAPAIAAATLPAVALFAVPAVALIERSLRTADGHSLANFAGLLAQPERAVLAVPVGQAILNSLAAGAVAAALAVGLGLLVVTLLAHQSRGARALDAIVALPLGVSAVVIGIGVLLAYSATALGGSWWLVPAVQTLVALPLAVRAMAPAARAVSPRARAAAASLGAGPWRVWRHVDWPALRAPAGVAAAFAFAVSLGEFGATSFVARPDAPTLTTAIYRLLGRPGIESVGQAFAASVVLAAMVAAVMMVSERAASARALEHEWGGRA